jgi:hypothetical protein
MRIGFIAVSRAVRVYAKGIGTGKMVVNWGINFSSSV